MKIIIKKYANGYETLAMDGEIHAGMPEGIDAWTVLHYLKHWYDFDIDFEKIYYDKEEKEIARV